MKKVCSEKYCLNKKCEQYSTEHATTYNMVVFYQKHLKVKYTTNAYLFTVHNNNYSLSSLSEIHTKIQCHITIYVVGHFLIMICYIVTTLAYTMYFLIAD